jgi:hypothetical protein
MLINAMLQDKALWRCGERTHLNCRIISQDLSYL